MTHYLLGVVTPAIDTPLDPILAPWDENNEDLHTHVDVTEAWLKRHIHPDYPKHGTKTFEDFVRNAFDYYQDKPEAPPRADYACGSGDNVRVYTWKNPSGKWDYWVEDQKYNRFWVPPMLVSKALTIPDFNVFALLSDGEWLARGDLGWFAAISEETPNWGEVLKTKLRSLNPDHYIRFVDCHT